MKEDIIFDFLEEESTPRAHYFTIGTNIEDKDRLDIDNSHLSTRKTLLHKIKDRKESP